MMELLSEIASQFSIDDPGFAQDLFCLIRMKGSGLPTDDRIDRMAAVAAEKSGSPELLVKLNMRKRKHVLTELTRLHYFKALCLECASTPESAVRRLLDTFRELTRKTQHAQCVSCQYLKSCAFGQQYSAIVTDITKVVDTDYTKKVHADCPEKPAIDNVNAFALAIDKMQQLSMQTPQGQSALAATGLASDFEKSVKALDAQTDGTDMDDPVQDGNADDLDPEEMANEFSVGGSGAGKNPQNLFQGTSTGAAFARTSEQLIKQLSATQMALFDLGRQLATSLARSTKGKFKPSPSVDERQKNQSMQSVNDVGQAVASEHAGSEEAFDAKVGKKTLQVRKYEQQNDKKFLLYILIDVSSSMSCQLRSSNYAMLTRGNLASTLAASLLHRAKIEGGMSILRFFSDNPGPKLKAENAAEFDVMIKTVCRQDYNGGGTSIMNALRRAFTDIGSAKDEIAKSEILLITDGDDYFSEEDKAFVLSNRKQFKVPMNTLDINSSRKALTGGAASLKEISSKYLKANADSLTIDNLVELVK